MNLQLLPKVELHLHLDCSLSYRVAKKIDPSITPEQYQTEFVAPSRCVNLVDFLNRAVRGFQLMQSVEHIQWVVEDLFEQLAADHILYAEIRFAPFLHTAGGLTIEEVAQAAETATRNCVAATGIEARLILCTLRHYTAEQSMQTVQLVHQFKGTYIAGFDIAGDEAGYPITNHIAAFEYAHQHGICCTAHAGEARGAESVWETLKYFKPTRIGHGVRSIEDPKLVEHLKKEQIHLELCPSCNVLISVIDHYDRHPIDKLYKAGVPINVNTDNRAVTNISLTTEYERLEKHFGWKIADFYHCNVQAIKAAFIPQSLKHRLIEQLTAGYQH
ncbi:MAG: adenosine deaminase [Bacteroidota bacterium]